MRTKSHPLLLATLLTLALCAASQPERAGAAPATRPEPAAWVAVDEAPMRYWRSAQAEVMLRLPRGALVLPLNSQGPWVRVREPGGQEGWLYANHLSSSPPLQATGDLFEPPQGSIILAEAAETARSNRSQTEATTGDCDALWAVLDMRLTPEALEDFLEQGGIGEYAHTQRRSRAEAVRFPSFHADARANAEAERQIGLNLAAMVTRRMAKPTFGNVLQRYVNLVGLAVARFAPGRPPHFRAVVLDLPEPVSFSLPGGVVMVSTGLLAALENEAQLACVLAHETAHAALSHLWAGALATQFYRRGGVVDATGVRTQLFTAMLEDLLQTVVVAGIDQKLEFEADLAAVQMAYNAGYDPQQLPRAIERIEKAGHGESRGGPPREWSALHPPTAQRLERLQRLLVALPGQNGLALGTERFRANR